jgi:hypothetical protein
MNSWATCKHSPGKCLVKRHFRANALVLCTQSSVVLPGLPPGPGVADSKSGIAGSGCCAMTVAWHDGADGADGGPDRPLVPAHVTATGTHGATTVATATVTPAKRDTPLVGGKRVSILLYADDVSLLATSPERMSQLLYLVDNFCVAFGMRPNATKCERLVFASDDNQGVVVGLWGALGG